MKIHSFFCILCILFCSSLSYAQDTQPTTTNLFFARTGVRLDAPHEGTYRYLEFMQIRGNWILPDFGALDFYHGDYRELFVGAGRTLYNSKKVTWAEELYFVQATGPAAKRARYLWPWTLVDIRFTPKLTSEIVYFPYVPLNHSARIQHVLERAKLEYALNKTWKMGGGYGAYKYGGQSWQNKPFITVTRNTGFGSFEFWLQKMPGGAQVQVRYFLAWHHWMP